MDSHRQQKLESLIIRVLSEITAKRMVRDPRISPLITFSYVKISSDLRNGEVGVSGYMSRTALRKSVLGLNHAAGFMQLHLSKEVRMRSIPRLRFVVDQSLEKGFDTVQRINRHITNHPAPSS